MGGRGEGGICRGRTSSYDKQPRDSPLRPTRQLASLTVPISKTLKDTFDVPPAPQVFEVSGDFDIVISKSNYHLQSVKNKKQTKDA